MRRSFLLWLFLLLCAAFAFTGALVYVQFNNHAEERATEILSTRLHDLMEMMKSTSENLVRVMEINNTSIIERTRAMAELIKCDQDILDDQEALQRICNELGLVRLYITDADGYTVASVPRRTDEIEYEISQRVRPFTQCIGHQGVELLQRPAITGAGKNNIQYAGVARRDAQGVVVTGFITQQEQMVRSAISFGKLASEYKLGERGHIIAFYGGETLNRDALPATPSELLDLPIDRAATITINEELFFSYAIEANGFRLIGLLGYDEIRQMTFDSSRRMLYSNLALFVLMFLTVAYLLQHFVVRGIHKVNASLKLISEGDLEERVNVHSSPEFTHLSTGINAMVDSLREYGEKENLRIQRELELARSIQATALPSKFPAFPNNPEFDIVAICTQAKVVGGDFYDLFKQGEDYLCFLVADVTDSGIPAALFMMRCMSLIRSIARTGVSPYEVVTEANRTLCEGNTSDMRVMMFYACLNIKTGELRYVSAGQPLALLQHEGEHYELLKVNAGRELGYLPNAQYTENTIILEPYDRIFLYTRGVIDAVNAEEEPFGTARLQEALRGKASSPAEVLRLVRTALRQFIRSGSPDQDITMLSLEYKGRMHARKYLSTLAGEQEKLPEELAEPLESVLAAPSSISDIQASVISILNTMPPQWRIDISVCCNNQEAEITLRYDQPQFNPLLVLPHLPIDDTRFHTEVGSGSVLTLIKHLE